MSTAQGLSIPPLGAKPSLVVQLVILLLVVVSFMSWYFICLKLFAIGRAQGRTEQFERELGGGGGLGELFESGVKQRHSTGSLERIFEAGYREFQKLKSQRGAADPSLMVDGARRAMRATYQREMDRLDSSLSFLASVGSVSPYVGLLGTVWGIMHAFRGLANMAQATLAAVAPGIAEALVATAIGLFAAIPAVVAYNRFSHNVDRLAVRFESFMEEFPNILQRQAQARLAGGYEAKGA